MSVSRASSASQTEHPLRKVWFREKETSEGASKTQGILGWPVLQIVGLFAALSGLICILMLPPGYMFDGAVPAQRLWCIVTAICAATHCALVITCFALAKLQYNRTERVLGHMVYVTAPAYLAWQMYGIFPVFIWPEKPLETSRLAIGVWMIGGPLLFIEVVGITVIALMVLFAVLRSFVQSCCKRRMDSDEVRPSIESAPPANDSASLNRSRAVEFVSDNSDLNCV